MHARGRFMVLLALGSVTCVGLPSDPSPLSSDGSGTTSTGTTAGPMTSGGPGTGTSAATGTGVELADDGSSSDETTDAPPDLPDYDVECDLDAQDCPDGEKCMPWANDGSMRWNATRCTPIDENPGQPGDQCMVEGSPYSGIDTCDIGAMCWGVDIDTFDGICVAMCTQDGSCDDLDTTCASVVQGLFTLCLPVCTPFLQDCAEGMGCYPSPESLFVCYPDTSGTSGNQGSPCDALYDCDPGLACLPGSIIPACDGAPSCCTSLCDVSTGGCPASSECVPFYEEGMAPAGYENVGVCIITM